MQFEQSAYAVEDYQCIELYPFACKNKRYFQAYRHQQDKSYRMIVYPIEMVKHEELVEHLVKLKGLNHPLLGKIAEIKEKTVLVSQGAQLRKEDVIAVLIENQEQPHPCYYHFYESLLEYGPYNQAIARTYILKLIDLIGFMRNKGVQKGFFLEDLYIEKRLFGLRVDNYGDRQFFKVCHSTLPDPWEVGNVLFTFFNKYPPYSQPNSTDKFFLLLKNHSYDKFWEKSRRKNNTPKKVVSFLNETFHQDCEWKVMQENDWLTGADPLSQNELAEQMKQILEAKQKLKIELQLKNKASRERYQETIRNMRNHQDNRGSELDEFLSLLLHKLNDEQNAPRKANQFSVDSLKGTLIPAHYQDENMIYAHILTLLESNIRQDITLCEIQDLRSKIIVRLDGIAEDQLEIDVKVVLEVVHGKKQNKFIKIQCIDGSLMEQIWVNSYFKRLLSEV